MCRIAPFVNHFRRAHAKSVLQDFHYWAHLQIGHVLLFVHLVSLFLKEIMRNAKHVMFRVILVQIFLINVQPVRQKNF